MFCLYLARQMGNIHVTVQPLNRQHTASAFAALAGDLPLMPWLAKVESPTTQGALVLNNQLSVSVSGDDLGDAVNCLRQRIALQTGWTLQPQAEKPDKPTIRIAIAKKVKPQPLPDSDESYNHGGRQRRKYLCQQFALARCAPWKPLPLLMQKGAENTSIPWVTIEDSPRFLRARAAARSAATSRFRILNARSTAWPRQSSTSCTGI